MTTRSTETEVKPHVVLKLRVNDNESWRRIPLFRLFNESKHHESVNTDASLDKNHINLSFDKLCKYAILYSGKGSARSINDNNIHNFDFRLTYKDEEGDQVELSTDEELVDAVLWKQESSDVLQILASVKLKKGSIDRTISPVDGQSYKAKPMLDVVDAIFSFISGSVEIIGDEIKAAQKKSSAHPSSQQNQATRQEDELERVELSFDPNFVHSRHTCDGCGVSPIIGHRYHATNIPDFDLCLECKNNCKISDIDFVQAQDGVGEVPNQYEGFDSKFVHSRHTCDGCGISPILGYRWHATNIPNYDLCHKCKSKTAARDVFFQLAQYKPDKSFSFREKKSWRNKKCSRSSQNNATNADPNPDDAVISLTISNEVQRAIEQSLNELKNKTKNIIKEQASINESASSNDVESASSVEEVFTSEAKEEPKKLSPSDLNKINESLVSTGQPIEDEDIEKAVYEASIASKPKPAAQDEVGNIEKTSESKEESKKLSSSDFIHINESLVSTGKPIEDEDVEKAFFEASISTVPKPATQDEVGNIEESKNISSSDLNQIKESLVSTGKPIEDEDIEKAFFEASIASVPRPVEQEKVENTEEKTEGKKLSPSEMIELNTSLLCSGKPIDNEELEKAVFESSVASCQKSMGSNVIQNTMQKIVASLASEEVSDEESKDSSSSSASEESESVSEKLSEVAFSSLSPSLLAEVISLEDLEYPTKDSLSSSENIESDSDSNSSFQDVSVSDKEMEVEIIAEANAKVAALDSAENELISTIKEKAYKAPTIPNAEFASLDTSKHEVSLNANENNEDSNGNLKQSETSASFVSAAEREGSITSQDSDSDTISSATNASISSEDSWNFVEENVHENIGSLLFQKQFK